MKDSGACAAGHALLALAGRGSCIPDTRRSGLSGVLLLGGSESQADTASVSATVLRASGLSLGTATIGSGHRPGGPVNPWLTLGSHPRRRGVSPPHWHSLARRRTRRGLWLSAFLRHAISVK